MKRRPNIKAAGFIAKIKVLFTLRDFAQRAQRAQSQNIMIFALTSNILDFGHSLHGHW